MVDKKVGDIYTAQKIVEDTLPYRFACRSYPLEHIKIHVETQAIYVGRQGYQVFPVAANGSLELYNVDLADLWFRNAVASAKVSIIGTTKS